MKTLAPPAAILKLQSGQSGGNVQAMEEPLDAWFKREILAHEAMLLRYLMRVWPRKHEVLDYSPDGRKFLLVPRARRLTADDLTESSVAVIKNTLGDSAIDTATAAQLERIRELLGDASSRIAHLLIVPDASIGADERRQLEEAAVELRYAIEYLNL